MSGDEISDDGGLASMRNDKVLRIVLVGKSGSGKGATGNTILGFEAFESRFAGVSVTDRCEEARVEVNGIEVSVVDTPGLFDSRYSEDETLKKISDCIRLASPGPQAFLLVIQLGRFTKEEQRSVEMIQKVFGQKSDKYTMVLFTHGDKLKCLPVEAFLKDCPELQELVSKCKGRYHVFNNETNDPLAIESQVSALLGKINQMVLENGGSHYTNEMFQEAARKIEEEKERECREMEEKKLAEREQLKEQVRKEEEKIKEEKEKFVKDIGEVGKTSAAVAAAGTALGAAVAAVTIGVEVTALAKAYGQIGAAAGGCIGLAIGGFNFYNKRRANSSGSEGSKKPNKIMKTSEERKPLINKKQSKCAVTPSTPLSSLHRDAAPASTVIKR